MKRKVPKKNISGDIADIRKSDGNQSFGKKSLPPPDSWIDEKTTSEFLKEGDTKAIKDFAQDDFQARKKSPLKKILLILIFPLLAAVLLWGAGVYAKWNNLINYFNSAGGELGRFLDKNEINPTNGAGRAGAGQFGVLDLVRTKAVWENAGSVYLNFQNFSVAGIGLVQELNALNEKWPTLLLSGGGRELIAHLRETKNYLESMSEANNKLSSLNLGFENFLTGSRDSSLSLQIDFGRFNDFLGTLINWLSSDGERHILILFENSSELRPGGGFIGSYADMIFSGGSVKSIEVHDINDADRKLEKNIVPPKPLQAIEKSWTIANSNWFLDFPLSASKALQLMEESKMYAGRISFDGVVAISPKVVSDILKLTGPVELKERGLTINKDNFLMEIQNEVQAAQAKGVPSKKILSELVPEFISKLNSFKPDNNKLATEKFNEWVNDKDLIIYFKDSEIESFLDFYGASGKIFNPPSDFNGDYLAVPTANIGGGKSDLFMKQNIFFRTQLNSDGTAADHLEISRRHNAGKKDQWWYRLPNESYIQVFTPADSSLSNFTGGWDRKIIPKINYAKSGYKTDELVAEIESTLKKNFNYPLVDEFNESGKKVFGFWSKTDPGQTSKISLDYSVNLFSPAAVGQKYQFVFEKQPGSGASYAFEIYAPVGFFWQESNSPVFEYETDDPNGRITFVLTIEKEKN
ncbi:MAG: DUF4012 domain-containing protein [Patescibacteria group bacterium]